MPELYGHPFKWELRDKIEHVETEWAKECAEHHILRIRYGRLADKLAAEIEQRGRAEQELSGLKKNLLELAGAPMTVLTAA